ncbi:MAG: HAMP domain-containing protein [Proteobacteria bacterium]|nr:HAMP domain-containing protein [Pseudomonadota bacterium]
MDIRIKISLTLVLVSLLSMAVLATIAYRTSAVLLKEFSVRQLTALAESKKRDLEKVHEGWKDQVRLIRSRSQLKSSLRRYLDTGDQDALYTIQRIVEDATTAVDSVDRITIFSVDGTEIASFGRVPFRHQLKVPDIDVATVGTFPSPTGGVNVALSSAITFEGQVVAGIEIVVDGDDLFTVTANYTGLGDTGEAVLVKLTEDGSAMVLNPLRHEPGSGYVPRPAVEASDDIRAALNGDQQPQTERLKDYRGIDVWSATRYLSELGWGLIVKVDADEEEARFDILREQMFDIALALSAFAIIGGALLGFHLARPIHELVVVVTKMRQGDVSVRADARGDDEIAYLAESLNEFAEYLESQRDSQSDA